ncbi:hypothetical protein HDU67_004160, partial [Dinochytrium kinnereticum]
MREILISCGAKDLVMVPLFSELEKGTEIEAKARHAVTDLKKDIKEIMLVGARDQEFDKNVTSVVERALSLGDEAIHGHLPALKTRIDEKRFRELGQKYQKEKVGRGLGSTVLIALKGTILKEESMLSDFPMTFDERIIKDHIVVKKLFDDFKKAPMEEKHRIGAEIIRNISIHSFSEEVTIYPLYEKNFENGKAIADLSRQEHGVVKQDSSKAESIKAGDTAFIDMMTKLEKDFCDHGLHEETRELPTLLSLLTREDAVKLGEKFEKNKGSAPTHPHPSAPDKGGITQKLGRDLSPAFFVFVFESMAHLCLKLEWLRSPSTKPAMPYQETKENRLE